MKFFVEVIDHRVRTIEIEAENPSEARRIVESMDSADVGELEIDRCEWYVDNVTPEGGETLYTDDMED